MSNFFARMLSSNAEKQLVVSTALQAGRAAAKDIGMKSSDVGKPVVIDAGKKLVEGAAKQISTPKSLVPPEEILQKK